jgi:hypothetical protein
MGPAGRGGIAGSGIKADVFADLDCVQNSRKA